MQAENSSLRLPVPLNIDRFSHLSPADATKPEMKFVKFLTSNFLRQKKKLPVPLNIDRFFPRSPTDAARPEMELAKFFFQQASLFDRNKWCVNQIYEYIMSY